MVVRTGVDVLLNFKNNLQLMKELKGLNAFVRESVTIAEKYIMEAATRRENGTPLSSVDGMTFGVKDNLCTKDLHTSCSSEFLRGYIPPYTASAVERLRSSGAVMVGKTNMDEFGMGSSNLYSCHGPTINPWSSQSKDKPGAESGMDEWVVCGGSSGGSAVAVAAGMCDFALGSDTGGSVRLPASFCGVVGLKPTYGHVSRYGLIPLASSMDTVGVLSPSVLTAANVLDVISGFDAKDSTSVDMAHASCSKEVQTDDVKDLLKDMRIGIPKDVTIPELSEEYKLLWLSLADRLANNGSSVSGVAVPHFCYGVPCYNILNCAEVTSNMAKYSGLIFGYNNISDKPAQTINELFTRNRVSGLGPVVQHRIIAGMYFLSYHGRHHYEKALRVRQLIHNEMDSLFSEKSPDSVDILLTPVTLGSAPSSKMMREKGPVESSVYDTYTVPVNLAGLPAVSVPVGLCSNGLPLGIQVIGKWMDEKKMLKAARAIELISSDTAPSLSSS